MYKSFAQILTELNDTQQSRGNSSFADLIDFIAGNSTMRLNRTLLDLTTAATPTLFTVPAGYKCQVDEVWFEGSVVPTGSTKLITASIGTTANSYNELLSGSNGGYPFDTTRNESLLANGTRIKASELWPALQLFNPKVAGLNNSQPPVLLSRTLIDLTAAASTNLIATTASQTIVVDHVMLEGQTTMSGGTSSKLLIGTSGASDVELLNNSTGVTFTSGTATSLLAVGARINITDSIALPTSMSTANLPYIAASKTLEATVSGTVVTAGKVYVEIWGWLQQNIIQRASSYLFDTGAVIKASLVGATAPTAGAAYCELWGRLISKNAT